MAQWDEWLPRGACDHRAGASFSSSAISAVTAIGVRRVGDETPVAASDLWHIGSITKSFTSTLIARHVERGEMSWASTLGELLTPARAGMEIVLRRPGLYTRRYSDRNVTAGSTRAALRAGNHVAITAVTMIRSATTV